MGRDAGKHVRQACHGNFEDDGYADYLVKLWFLRHMKIKLYTLNNYRVLQTNYILIILFKGKKTASKTSETISYSTQTNHLPFLQYL